MADGTWLMACGSARKWPLSSHSSRGSTRLHAAHTRPPHARPTLTGMTQRDGQDGGQRADTAASGGEVLISGLDTGPSSRDRENLSPTSAQARLHPWRPNEEPTDEDG